MAKIQKQNEERTAGKKRGNNEQKKNKTCEVVEKNSFLVIIFI